MLFAYCMDAFLCKSHTLSINVHAKAATELAVHVIKADRHEVFLVFFEVLVQSYRSFGLLKDVSIFSSFLLFFFLSFS